MHTLALKPQSFGIRPVLVWFGTVFSVINAAIAVAAATESHRKPLARDLRILGINPDAFTAH